MVADPPSAGWAAVAALAELQAGNVATWQAGELGIAQARLTRRQRDEGWGRPHRSVAKLPGVPPSTAQELWAALLAVADLRAAERPGAREVTGPPPRALGDLRDAIGEVACVTAWSAAERRGHDRPAPARPQLLVAHSVTTTRRSIRVIRSRLGIAGMWRWVDGLPLATPARMIWDAAHLARGLPGAVSSVVDLAVFADRTRLLPVPLLLLLVDEPVLAGLPRTPPPVLRSVATQLGHGYSHSRTEAAARRIAAEVAAQLGVQLHPSPYPIIDPSGRIVAEADIAAPELRFDAEIDGPYHRGPLAAAQHARRRARTDPLDWIVMRYPVDEATDRLDEAAFRHAFAVDLRRVMAQRREQAA